jgi:hypothetical protein
MIPAYALCLLLAAAEPGSVVVKAPDAATAPEPEASEALLTVRRIHVERLNGTDSAQIRDMIITALQASRLFVLTENPERADAILRGSAEDLIYTDTFQSSDSIDGRAGVGSNGTGSGRRGGVNLSVGQHETTRIAERKHEATASVRLVSRDGDVIWSTTQESLGAKFRGSSADVADKVARQLVADYERARKSAPKP